MKILKCNLFNGEVDIIGGFTKVVKIIKCRKCGFSNEKKHNIIVVTK